MKKYIPFLIAMFVLLTLEVHAQSCTPVSTYANSASGTLVDTRHSHINCHQYVRTALLNNGVNLTDGKFKSGARISSNSSWISSDANNFVKVCRKEYAEAICFSGISGQPDHSALVLSAGIITGATGSFASTPGHGSSVYRHGHASMLSGGGTKFHYYAALPKISGSASISSGQTKSYSFTNKSYISNITWSVSNPSLQIVSSNGSSASVKASCASGSGTYYVRATITIKDSGETKILGKAVTVGCGTSSTTCHSNTLDNNTLNTFNYVSSGPHKVIMGLTRSWQKSSGYVNYWYTRNSGKELNFSIPSGGYVTFRASSGTCGTQNFTFYAPSYYGKSSTVGLSVGPMKENSRTEFRVYGMLDGNLIRKGTLNDYHTETPLRGLPDGYYILHIGDTRQKVFIANH